MHHLICRRLKAAPKGPYSLHLLLNQPPKRLVSSSRPSCHLRRSETAPETLASHAQTPPPLLPATSAVSNEGVSLGSIFFTSLCAITFGLGVWQTQRYFEKVELVKKREEDLKLDALSYTEWMASKGDKLDSSSDGRDDKQRSYRLVSLKGSFQHSNQVLIGPRGPPPGALAESGPNSGRGGGGGMSSSMQGYWVLTPFIIAGDNDTDAQSVGDQSTGKRGWFGLLKGKQQKSDTEAKLDNQTLIAKEQTIVWVNRGWIPRHYISKDLKILQPWSQPQGTVEIMTMESETEKAGRFSPPSRLETIKNEPNDNDGRIQKLLWLDRQAIAEMTSCPLGSEPPLFVQISDATTDEIKTTFPVRSSREYVGEFKVTPEVHLGYATTWFGLSGAGVLMTRKLLRKGR
ncbi:hypothetical protein ACHAXN_010146 [Cyclotella atomus]|jgi:surfeit locus 1 family protein